MSPWRSGSDSMKGAGLAPNAAPAPHDNRCFDQTNNAEERALSPDYPCAAVKSSGATGWRRARACRLRSATRHLRGNLRMEKYIHNGVGTVRAYVYGKLDLLDFTRDVFGARELERNSIAHGYHVQAQIGDSVIVLSATDPPYEKATTTSIYVYVPDVDATYQRALAAGATSLNPPTEKPWKGRMAGVRDSFGNIWYI